MKAYCVLVFILVTLYGVVAQDSSSSGVAVNQFISPNLGIKVLGDISDIASSFNRALFDTHFKQAVSTALNIATGRIQILACRAGSILVVFSLSSVTNDTSSLIEVLPVIIQSGQVGAMGVDATYFSVGELIQVDDANNTFQWNSSTLLLVGMVVMLFFLLVCCYTVHARSSSSSSPP
jgi:hypothetical protein